MLLTLLILASVKGYNLTDCISFDFTFNVSETAQVQNVLDCENICSVKNSSWLLIRQEECSCYKERSKRWNSINRDECNLKCQDGLPCGGTARYSLYEIDQKKNVNFTAPQINTISLGSGDGTDVRNIARISAITVGILGFLGLMFLLVYCLRKKKQIKIPQIEENSLESSENSVKYLIKDLLPMAPTGLYSVITSYKARKGDEISLEVDQVVAIKEAYSDKWARGTNVTTGNQGFFPLTCLVSDEKYLKKGVEIPPRKRSKSII